MRLGRYSFTPRPVPALATALLLPLLVGLGFWQLDRAGQKRMIEQTANRRIEAPPLVIDAPRWRSIHEHGAPAELAYRRVVMRGGFEQRRQYLLDNRTRNGVAGFEVLSVFLPDGAGGGVLVNRGWIPLGERRRNTPPLPVPAAPLTISGAFDAVRTPLPLLGASGYEQQAWPKIVQRVDLEAMTTQLGLSLLPLMVRLDPKTPGGFVREWKPYYGMPAARHNAYAFQWFALAAALVIIFIVVNSKRIDDD